MILELNKYEYEIRNILEKIEALENGEYHERIKKPGVPNAMTIGTRLKREFIELLESIKDEDEGLKERVNKAVRELNLERR